MSITVLIVEDERKLRWSLLDKFLVLGTVPITASSGLDALRLATEHRPELILLDCLLPELHGFELARLIRHIAADYHPYVVVMTAIYKSTRYRNDAKLKYGVDEYLIKPIQPHVLRQLVCRVKAAA